MAKKENRMKVTEFGKAVKMRLLEMEKTQAWLIERVKERTGDTSFDTSWLHRLLVGKVSGERGYNGNPGKAVVIREILGMNEEE